MTIVIERRHYVMRPALAALALADVAAIFTTVALVADPAFYARALLLSLLALQFTQLFFVRTPALTVVITSTIGYAIMLIIGVAGAATPSPGPSRAGWSPSICSSRSIAWRFKRARIAALPPSSICSAARNVAIFR